MGVGVTCPNCRNSYAFYCSKCSSYETEVYESFELADYFQTGTKYYLKCRRCLTEHDHTICPDCSTRIIPEEPFVTGDRGSGANVKKCFIATACLDENSHILDQLYEFRDEVLLKSHFGQQFVRYYYLYSPKPAACISTSKPLKTLAKYALVYPAYYVVQKVMRILALFNVKGEE